MKRVLCYGDSNTWGWNPSTKERYPEDERWTGILQEKLGNGYKVIEEGLNGRTTVWDDPIEGYKNGKKYLIPCLESHRPIDLVIIMLGTNDLKKRFSLSAQDIASGVGVLLDIVKKSNSGRLEKPPKLLLVTPPPITELTEFTEMFEEGKEKSIKFTKFYKQVSEEKNCDFFDSSTIVKSSNSS